MTRRVSRWVVGSVALALVATPLAAVENVQLSLRINGENVPGEGPPGPWGNSIECFAYEQAATAPRDASGMATGRRQYQPITIRKQIDKTTPQIESAFIQNRLVEAIFRFFRTGPGGQRVNVYTVQIKDGRIIARKDVLASTVDAATANVPAYEEVSFGFKSITWTWLEGGITATDEVTVSTTQLPTRVRLPGGQ